jgi:two-component system response regulator AdeR
MARARAILRRAQGGRQSAILHAARLSIDTEAHVVMVDGEPLAVTLTEFRLLAHMVRSPNRVFERGELIDACLPAGEAMNRTVDSHMSNLRRKLSMAGVPDLLVGVRGVGYRLDVPHG